MVDRRIYGFPGRKPGLARPASSSPRSVALLLLLLLFFFLFHIQTFPFLLCSALHGDLSILQARPSPQAFGSSFSLKKEGGQRGSYILASPSSLSAFVQEGQVARMDGTNYSFGGLRVAVCVCVCAHRVAVAVSQLVRRSSTILAKEWENRAKSRIFRRGRTARAAHLAQPNFVKSRSVMREGSM